jgi:hypothetical protein
VPIAQPSNLNDKGKRPIVEEESTNPCVICVREKCEPY